MERTLGWASLIQAAIYATVAVEAGRAWAPATALFGAAAVAQVVGGGALLAGRGPAAARVAGVVGLGATTVIGALVVQACVHIVAHFTPVGGDVGRAVLAGSAIAAPWLVAVPIAQLAGLRGRAVAGAAALLLVAGGIEAARLARGARMAPVDGPAVAAWLYARTVNGDPSAAPTGPGPVRLGVTLLRDGRGFTRFDLRGDTLEEALAAVPSRVARTEAVHLDVVVRDGPAHGPWWRADVVLAAPGESTVASAGRIPSSAELWHGDAVRSVEIVPGVAVPALRRDRLGDGPLRRLRVRAFLASGSGVTPLVRSWAPAPALTADSAREAAIAGARMLAANQDDTGRYAYVVRGPEGTRGSGYNFPRHAGTTWFLARVARRTGDPEIRAAAAGGLRFLRDHTVDLGDGRAAVVDPARSDGRVWVGTTALALLAAIALEDDRATATAWAGFVASSVDAAGQVRGDLDRATGTWPEQAAVTYAQGQGMLALAAAVRAGVGVGGPPLERAVGHVSGAAYMPMPAGAFLVLDEHWMCLAASAVYDVYGRAAGEEVCSAYLGGWSTRDPAWDGVLQAPTGASGGLAEALVARAWLARQRSEPDPWLARSLAYGEVFLRHQYRPDDAPLLGRPGALIGGFRSSAWSLDVQIDAVQHIGSALLGVEQLLSGSDFPGGMP